MAIVAKYWFDWNANALVWTNWTVWWWSVNYYAGKNQQAIDVNW